jgi:hypothetical protein
MNNDDIDSLYEQIFGQEERPNIFRPDDEEYIALRQEILSSKREFVTTKRLPFSGIRIVPYEKCIVQVEENRGHHIFYLKEYKDFFSMSVYAAGYYDAAEDKFVVLQNSFCIYTDYFRDLSQKQKIISSFSVKCSRSLQNEVVKYDSAALAASYFLGRKSSFRAWRDESGKSLDAYFEKYRRSNIDALEDSTFPGYIAPEVKWTIGGIVSALKEKDKSVVARRTMSPLLVQRPFYIKKDTSPERACDAMGVYDVKSKNFILQAGSLIALTAVPSYDASSAGLSRARFIARYCSKETNGYRLKNDRVFETPTAAASYVLGRSANGWLEWRDEDGKTLDSSYRKTDT